MGRDTIHFPLWTLLKCSHSESDFWTGYWWASSAKSVSFKRPSHPPPKVQHERRHQSWTISAWNIRIAGINHSLSELLRLLTRRSRSRGQGEVFETIFQSDFLSFSPRSVDSSGCRYHRISPSSILNLPMVSSLCTADQPHPTCLSSMIPNLNWKHHSVVQSCPLSTWNRI